MRNVMIAIRRAWRKLSGPAVPEPPAPMARISTTRTECVEEMRSAMARLGINGRTPIDPPQRTSEVTGRVVR